MGLQLGIHKVWLNLTMRDHAITLYGIGIIADDIGVHMSEWVKGYDECDKIKWTKAGQIFVPYTSIWCMKIEKPQEQKEPEKK